MPYEQSKAGTGRLRSGQHDLGVTQYEIHVGISNRPGKVVELESPPRARDGEVLDLLLEGGRVLQIVVRGVSPYCRVIGERPAHERRHPSWDSSMPPEVESGRRRSDTRGFVTIQHPCPRCLTGEVLVTHRGVMLTTLFCPACRHGWGEPPAAIAAATRTDRRSLARADSNERRADNRLVAPTCEYCGTDAHVQPVRRTANEIYFACVVCDAMWALERSNGRPPHPTSLTG